MKAMRDRLYNALTAAIPRMKVMVHIVHAQYDMCVFVRVRVYVNKPPLNGAEGSTISHERRKRGRNMYAC